MGALETCLKNLEPCLFRDIDGGIDLLLECVGKTSDLYIEESPDNRGGCFILRKPPGHQVLDLILCQFTDCRFVGEFGTDNQAFDLRDSVDPAVFEDQALAFEMAPCTGSFPLDITPGYDCPASRDGTGDQLRT